MTVAAADADLGGAELVLEGWVKARANVNIALIKYWGKASATEGALEDRNLPAVPSLSLTLDGLYSETWARFAPELDEDALSLDGQALIGEERARAVALLEVLRRRAGVAAPFEVRSHNAVPTGAGLASSASGMAALAGAAGRLCGLLPDAHAGALSEIARVGSGSAARSIFGGWVSWVGRRAEPLAGVSHLPVSVVVAIVARGKKAVGSREGMLRTMRTSPFYAGWVQQAHATFDEACRALDDKDLARLMAAMERSTWRMHGSAMGADPPVFYWLPGSLAALGEVAALKAEGVVCGATLDAGPNVKVFCLSSDAAAIASRLLAVPGVTETITSSPGVGIQVQIETREPAASTVPRAQEPEPGRGAAAEAGPDGAVVARGPEGASGAGR